MRPIHIQAIAFYLRQYYFFYLIIFYLPQQTKSHVRMLFTHRKHRPLCRSTLVLFLPALEENATAHILKCQSAHSMYPLNTLQVRCSCSCKWSTLSFFRLPFENLLLSWKYLLLQSNKKSSKSFHLRLAAWVPLWWAAVIQFLWRDCKTPFYIHYVTYWTHRHYHSNLRSSSFLKICFIASSSWLLGLLQSEYIFSFGYHQTGPLPSFP